MFKMSFGHMMGSLWLIPHTLRTQFGPAARKQADDVHFPYGCCAGGCWDSCANPAWQKLWA